MTDTNTLKNALSNNGLKTWAQLLESEFVIKAQADHPYKAYQVDSIEREMRGRHSTSVGFTIPKREGS